MNGVQVFICMKRFGVNIEISQIGWISCERFTIFGVGLNSLFKRAYTTVKTGFNPQFAEIFCEFIIMTGFQEISGGAPINRRSDQRLLEAR